MKPSPPPQKLIFGFFFFSGFCGLLYQVVWIRLAFASFGITTPVLSVVLSVFMAGLALGSWGGGHWVSRRRETPAPAFLYGYALCEGWIGLGAWAVPLLFGLGEASLLPLGSTDSTRYLLFSAVALLVSLLPWCLGMGATFPFMLAYLQKKDRSTDGFSFLYTANTLGAMAGTFMAPLLVEEWGFRRTLWAGAALNATIALAALALARRKTARPSPEPAAPRRLPAPDRRQGPSFFLPLLFSTGFISMAMEVVWTRDFTLVLGNQVYSFASILFTYLLATFAGAWHYRWSQKKGPMPSLPLGLGLSFFCALLTLGLNDPRIQSSKAGVLLSIVPFCFTLGHLTPRLVDHYSGGDPRKASGAYAVNILGCILGPLAASYLLLPLLGVKLSLVLLSFPLLFFLLQSLPDVKKKNAGAWALAVSGALFAVACLVWAGDFEEIFSFHSMPYVLRRDYSATVVSCGTGMDKQLYVNGIGMTSLIEDTKMMAHLPLACLSDKPRSALDICFGMGTTFRSLSRWGIKVTAVELVPSVPKAFGFFFQDAREVLSNPLCSVVVDDGNRFLRRTNEKYDVITIDPPPPLEAAGSSLLYSAEFFGTVRAHLREGGILQVWVPVGDYSITQAVARSLSRVFPQIRVFAAADGWGYYFLASGTPMPRLKSAQLLARMPAAARADISEWAGTVPAQEVVHQLLSREIILSSLMSPDPRLVITNDHPYNEYFFLRHLRGRLAHL